MRDMNVFKLENFYRESKLSNFKKRDFFQMTDCNLKKIKIVINKFLSRNLIFFTLLDNVSII